MLESSEEVRNGGFWELVGRKEMETPMSTSEEAGKEFWAWTQKELVRWK